MQAAARGRTVEVLKYHGIVSCVEARCRCGIEGGDSMKPQLPAGEGELAAWL